MTMKAVGGYGWDAAGAAGVGAAALTLAGIHDTALQMIATIGLGILVWNTTARNMVRRWAKSLKAEKLEVWVKRDTIETLRRYDAGLLERVGDTHAKLGCTPLNEQGKHELDTTSVVLRALEMGADRALKQGHERKTATQTK